jgi:hypothetical protein
MKLFMGLDLSLTGTGCVVLDESGEIVSHNHWGEKLPRKARVRDKIERMIYIAEKVVGAVKDAMRPYIPEMTGWRKAIYDGTPGFHVGIENYAFYRKGAQNDLGEIQGIVKSQLWLALGLEPVMITSSTARKTVMGKGNIPKKEILPELGRRGLELKDHNEADAYVIAECLRLSTLEGDDR